MIGLIVCAIYAVVLGVKGNSPENVYGRATKLLFGWYVVTASLAWLSWFSGISFGAILTTLLFGPLAALVATGFSTVILTLIIASMYAFQLAGAYLMRSALLPTVSGTPGSWRVTRLTYTWRTWRLVVGIFLVSIGLILPS